VGFWLTALKPALVTYVTAGYPAADDTVDILLGMEAGGAGKKFSSNWQFPLTNHPDIIELGIPFTDPIADGPTIQTANTVRVSYRNGTMWHADNCTASSQKRNHGRLNP
jgi:tryptophan synthase